MKANSGIQERNEAFNLWAEWVLSESGMPFFGTLLGLQRDGELIPLDDDVDFILPLESLASLESRIHELSGKISVRNDWLIQVGHKISGNVILVDFYFFQRVNGSLLLPWGIDGTPWHESSHLVLPEEFFDWGRENWIGNPITEASELLEKLYGKKWELPQKRYLDYESHVINNKVIVKFPGPIRRHIRTLELNARQSSKFLPQIYAYFLGIVTTYPVFLFTRLKRFPKNLCFEHFLKGVKTFQ